MNANKTLARLNKEYNKVSAQLKEESNPRKFWLVPAKAYGESDEHYWRVTYFQYQQHNNQQQAKVNRLNSIANDLTAQMCRIKYMNAVKRFFIA